MEYGSRHRSQRFWARVNPRIEGRTVGRSERRGPQARAARVWPTRAALYVERRDPRNENIGDTRLGRTDASIGGKRPFNLTRRVRIRYNPRLTFRTEEPQEPNAI